MTYLEQLAIQEARIAKRRLQEKAHHEWCTNRDAFVEEIRRALPANARLKVGDPFRDAPHLRYQNLYTSDLCGTNGATTHVQDFRVLAKELGLTITLREHPSETLDPESDAYDDRIILLGTKA